MNGKYSALAPFAHSNGKFGISSRRGTLIPFDSISELSHRFLKSGTIVVKIVDKKGEVFYSDEREIGDRSKDKCDYDKIVARYNDLINLHKYYQQKLKRKPAAYPPAKKPAPKVLVNSAFASSSQPVESNATMYPSGKVETVNSIYDKVHENANYIIREASTTHRTILVPEIEERSSYDIIGSIDSYLAQR